MTTINLCPVCGAPLRRQFQPSGTVNDGAALEDCVDPECALYTYTLEAGKHALLTPDEIAEAARVNAVVRERNARIDLSGELFGVEE